MAPNQSMAFSPREMEVLALAWQCMETQPKVDMNKLAALTGYTVGSVGVTFNKIKQKIRTLADSVSGAPSVPSTPRKTSKAATPTSTARKRKNAAAADAVPGTPSKKSKKVVQNEVKGDGDDEQLLPDMFAVKKEEDKDDFLDGDNDFVFLSEL